MSGDSPKKTAKQTAAYRCWFNAMLDRVAKSIVASRVDRLQMGPLRRREAVWRGRF